MIPILLAAGTNAAIIVFGGWLALSLLPAVSSGEHGAALAGGVFCLLCLWGAAVSVPHRGVTRKRALLGAGVAALLASIGLLSVERWFAPAAADLLRGYGRVVHAIAPTIAVAWIGSRWGRRSGRRGVLRAMLLAGLWSGLGLLLKDVLQGAWLDASQAALAFVLAMCVIAGVLGCLVAALATQLPMAEFALTAAGMGTAAFLYVVARIEPISRLSELPREQLVLLAAVVPPVALLMWLALGGAVGYLFRGDGRLDFAFRLESQIALRYLSARRRGGFIGAATWVSGMGVALGVAALIVVLSVMSGFEEDLKGKILGAHAHITVSKLGNDFTEYDSVAKRLRSVPGVDSAVPFLQGEVMIASASAHAGAMLKGLDPDDPEAVRELRSNLEKGQVEGLKRNAAPEGRTTDVAVTGEDGVVEPRVDHWNDVVRKRARKRPGVIIGRELARLLRVYVGDTVKLVSPISDAIGPTGPLPKLRRFRVAGIFYTGMHDYDRALAYLDLREAQRFFGRRGKATGIEVRVRDVDDTARLSSDVLYTLGGHPFTAKDWRTSNRELFSALLLEKLAMFVILAFIVLVASFNIVATLVMIVLERGREIAMLKSLGATERSVMKVFAFQGVLVGGLGAVLGMLVGLAVCALLAKYGLPIDQVNFYIEKLPVAVSRTEVGVVTLAAIIMSFLATVYPSLVAARLRPVEGLRDE